MVKNSKIRKVPRGQKQVSDVKSGDIHYVTMLEVKRFDVNYFKIFKMADEANIFQHDMPASTFKLFIYFCFICGQDNIATTDNATMIENTRTSKSTIALAKTQLLDIDYIRIVSKNRYMVNPNISAQVDGEKREYLVGNYNRLIKMSRDIKKNLS